jgi:hypothetical protein
MKILNLSNIKRIDETAIYYLRKYNAIAEIQFPIEDISLPINFTIETTSLGTTNLTLCFDRNITYPLLPLKRKLTEYIKDADSEGKLPC